MNKTKAKNVAKKVLSFVFFRAIELTVFYFFARFALGYFDGWHFYAVCGAVLFAYLSLIGGYYADSYRELHRYDNVKL